MECVTVWFKDCIPSIKTKEPSKIVIATGSGGAKTPDVMKSVGYDKIIEEENLDEEETYKFVKKSFERGNIETEGLEISAILPPMDMFSKDKSRLKKKNVVIDRLLKFFDKFFSITSNSIFTKSNIAYKIDEDISDSELINLANEESEEAKEILFEKYQYIINLIIKKYITASKKYNVEYNDLYQEALVGFTDAINRYNDTSSSLPSPLP